MKKDIEPHWVGRSDYPNDPNMENDGCFVMFLIDTVLIAVFCILALCCHSCTRPEISKTHEEVITDVVIQSSDSSTYTIRSDSSTLWTSDVTDSGYFTLTKKVVRFDTLGRKIEEVEEILTKCSTHKESESLGSSFSSRTEGSEIKNSSCDYDYNRIGDGYIEKQPTPVEKAKGKIFYAWNYIIIAFGIAVIVAFFLLLYKYTRRKRAIQKIIEQTIHKQI